MFRVFISYCIIKLHPQSHKKVDILKLCSSKIAWDNYALLQMILEYFPAFGRYVHCVKISKKLSSFVGIRTCQKRAAILDFECWQTLGTSNITHNAMLWKARVISTLSALHSYRVKLYFTAGAAGQFYCAKPWCSNATESGSFGTRNKL